MSSENTPKRASGIRPKKRKFTGNIHTRKLTKIENDSLNNSASQRKLSVNKEIEYNSSFEGYRIMDVSHMFSILEKFLCCKACGGEVSITEEIECGLSSKISILCENCAEVIKFKNSKKIGENNKISEINYRYIYAIRSIGLGYAAMKLFCGIMDLPQPVSKKSYNAAIKVLQKCSASVAEKSMIAAASEEVTLTGSSCLNISGDGTWKTRGHTSRIGVCTVIGDKSGKVIDTEVLSSFCKSCDAWKLKKGTHEYDSWKKTHENDCLNNHDGSAGKMELSGMVRIFQRSEATRNAKYIGYIGDGDAKTFQAISEASPYGSDTKVEKIECVGHIQKRMGTRLRKLKQNKVKCSEGKALGGKGRLTDNVIAKLTDYYGNAIRQNKNNLHEMRKAIWAAYFHTRSNDAEPLHSFCPTGRESWCKYNKAVACGTIKTFKHKNTVPTSVMDTIKPIFNDLSQPKLLSRCLGGKTQNNNESINSLIWKLCPKTQGVGRRIVEIATNEAVILFNDGNQGKMNVMQEFGLTVGAHARGCLKDLDDQRIAISNLRFLQNTKEARKSKRMKEIAQKEKFLLEEGEIYSAGAF